jgi:hypothetical protein
MKTQNEVLDRGYKALLDALGVVDAVRFIQHFSPGYGDYTKERHQWLDQQSLDDVFAEMRNYKKVDNIEDFEEVIE